MTDMTDIEVWVEDFLSELIEKAGMDIFIEEMTADEDGMLRIGLAGPDSARAIGREGHVLEAIQHLMVAASIHGGIPHRRIVVDVENYRQRKEKRLAEEAVEAAEEVLDTGRAVDFEPMSPRERRVVHMALSTYEGVSTESAGHGEDRYVRVFPAPRQ